MQETGFRVPESYEKEAIAKELKKLVVGQIILCLVFIYIVFSPLFMLKGMFIASPSLFAVIAFTIYIVYLNYMQYRVVITNAFLIAEGTVTDRVNAFTEYSLIKRYAKVVYDGGSVAVYMSFVQRLMI